MKKRIIIIIFLSIALFFGTAIGIKRIERKHARAMISAIEENDLEELSRLCKKPISKDVRPYFLIFDVINYRPLSFACYKGNFEAVKILVESGAKIDIIGPDPDLPLSLAISGYYSKNKYEIIYYLIEKGADINKTCGANGDAAIAQIIQYLPKTPEYYELFLYLIEKGADIYKSSLRGCILFEACEANDIKTVQYLFDHYNLDVNMRSCKGPYIKVYYKSLLMMTTYRDAAEVCEYLIEKGIDKNLKDSDGKTAYDYAIEYKASKILELLS